MKKFFIFIICLSAQHSMAQLGSLVAGGGMRLANAAINQPGSLATAKFTIDSVNVQGHNVPVQHISEDKLDRIINHSELNESIAATHIKNLQSALQLNRERLIAGRAPMPRALSEAKDLVEKIRNTRVEVNISGYLAELDYYDGIQQKEADAQAATESQKRMADLKIAENNSRIADSIEAIAQARKAIEDERLRIEKAKQDSIWQVAEDKRQAAYAADIYKKYGKVNGNHILAGEVVLGMTKKMCELAWGTPQDIHRTVSSSIVLEHWYYDGIRRYLSFKNGVLYLFHE